MSFEIGKPSLALPHNEIVEVTSSVLIQGELGVIALKYINRDTLIFNITGPIVPEATIYTFQVAADKHLDPKDSEDRPGFGHFTNHSCDPSAYIRILHHNGNGEIEVRARKGIDQGHEITVDYAAMEYNPLAKGLDCKCGSLNCRGVITGYKDLPSHVKFAYIQEGIVSTYLQDLDRKVK